MSHRTVRAFFILVIVLAQIFTGVTPARAAPPANDDFANAEEIASLPFSASVNNTEASLEPGEPDPQFCNVSFRTLWYLFTPAEDVAVRLNGPSNGNVNVFLASGPAFSDLTFLTCTAVADSRNFAFKAGQTYYLQVDSDSIGQGATLQFSLEQLAAPANDNFSNAQTIAALPFSAAVDNTDASREFDESPHCGSSFQSVWYSFAPSANMTIHVDMAGSQMGGTVEIFLASGPALSDLTSLTCASTYLSANFQAEASQTYYLRVDSYSDPGILQINLQQITPPANDNFADSAAIGSLPFSASVDNTNATHEIGEPTFCESEFRSIWYSFSPAADMTVRVDLAGSQVAGAVTIFLGSGSSLSDLTPVECVYTGSSTNFAVTGGQTYYLRADSFQQPGVLQINLQQITPPANDNFANAQEISSLPFSASADNTNATVEPGEPGNCGGTFRSMWYSFTPAEDMVLRLDMVGSQVGGNMAIFLTSGPALSDLTILACASSIPTNVGVEGGQTYYLRLASYSEPGILQINLQQITPPANDNFANAQEISSLPFSASADNTNATIEFNESQRCTDSFRSVWYSFTPAEDVALRLDMVGSQVDGAAGIYLASGSAISDLSFVACASTWNPTNFVVTGGQTYYLLVDSDFQPGVLHINLQQIIPPANDNFANAQEISSLPFSASVDNTNATAEFGEPAACGDRVRTVWYSFTPAQDMALRLEIMGSQVSGIADVFVASGPGITDLTFLTCADPYNSSNFKVEAGNTYYLRMDSYYPGVLQLNLQRIFPPVNDDFANAESIVALPTNLTVDNTDATREPGEPSDCGFFRSLWYTFTPTENMTVRINTAGSDVYAYLTIYLASGPGLSELNFVACAGSYSQTAQLTAGQTYYLRLDSSEQAGTLQLNLAQPNPPTNDNFAGAVSIGSVPFTATVDITDATVEPNEPQYCDGMSNTVWYAFTAPDTMTLRADTFGSSVISNVNIYKSSGATISDLEFVLCSGQDSSPAFLAEAGQTYYLQAGSIYLYQEASIQINLRPTFPPPNDTVASAVAVTALPFSATVDVTDATNEPDEPQACIYMPNTAWYSFSPTETMKVRADTQGSQISGNINVYHATGNGFANLQFMQCSYYQGGAAAVLAEAGETYFFQVGGQYGQSGTVQFNLAEMPTISGRVTDAVTGAPVPGNAPPYANVTLLINCGEGCFTYANSQNADGEGRFAFDSFYYGSPLSAGTYLLEVHADLYPTKQFGPFEFSGNKVDLGDVPLSPSAKIRGRAVDAETGNPLAGIYVNLSRCYVGGCFEYVNSQYTDGNGQFQFNSYYFGAPLPGGTYELTFSDNLHETKRLEIRVGAGEDHNVGDVALTPFPLIGSISGTLIDIVTGQPVSPTFTPSLALFRCLDGNCWQFVNSVVPDSLGKFSITTDYSGNPIPVGTFQIQAYADQYQSYTSDLFTVGEAVNRDVGNVRMTSYPVRFSEMQACSSIPATGGDCVYSVKITNGQPTKLEGLGWSLVSSYLPDSFAHYTDFRAGDNQALSLAPGKSKVLQFRFTVPANRSSYGSFVCARLFVGQGNNPLLTTIGFKDLFCVMRNANGFTIASPVENISTPQTSITASTGSELEPNNACQTAQDLTEAQYPFALDGALDSSQSPDVDFFRFMGTPGSLITIDLEGQSTGKGTLYDPLLGVFDSNCNLVTIQDYGGGYLNPRLDLTVPDDGVFVLAATGCCDYGFYGGVNGSYQLSVTPVQYLGSITGVVTDAATGTPLRGDAAPFAFVRLLQCTPAGCYDVSGQLAGADGRFSFSTDANGAALRVGDYVVLVQADQYQFYESQHFNVGEGENYDTGSLPLTSYPVRFNEIQPCAVPTDGAVCEFSVKITNGLSTRLSGKAWSIINAYGIGTFTNFTHFQTDAPLDVSLDRGKSKVLTFRFRVRGTVPNGAYICATVYVGQSPDTLFNTVGQRLLFCFAKGSNGFTLMSEQEMHQKLLHEKIQEFEPKNQLPVKK